MTRAITLHQPWASLVALGVKSVETRSWKAPDAAVGERLLIHAGARQPEPGQVGDWSLFAPQEPTEGNPHQAFWRIVNCQHHDGIVALPLGAIVASCTLAACVPMAESIVSCPESAVDRDERHVWLDPEYSMRAVIHTPDPKGWGGWGPEVDVTDQLPYGDFHDGRWAWLLEDVAPCEPIPAKGHQRLWRWKP